MAQQAQERRIDQFSSGPGVRADEWRGLVEAAKAWSSGSGDRTGFEEKLSRLAITEEYHAYPGLRLMAALTERAAAGDAAGTLALAMRITQSLQTRSFRQHVGDWDAHADADANMPDLLPPGFGETRVRRPYFETLIVTGIPATNWSNLAAEWRKLRRPVDAFIYEPVFTGSFEDAFCAAMLNPDLGAVIVNEGFAQHSRHDAPVLRSLTTSMDQHEISDSALALARTLKRIRPELDVYLVSNRNVEELAGNPEADVVRRIFYSVEELLELHLAILEGIQDRFETPFFDNLKKYAQRPIGTFHALPIARGKSVFRSDWIRDMGEFYGPNLFLAESSATTGGLDSLLEPTGNIKRAQEKAARAFGADQVFLCHQWHVDVEQDGGAGADRSGRYRDRRPQLPQIASLRHGASGRAAALCRSLPDDGILDVWRGAAQDHQAGAVEPEGRQPAASGQDGGPDQLHLRRPHLQHPPGDGGVSGDQARSDLPLG